MVRTNSIAYINTKITTAFNGLTKAKSSKLFPDIINNGDKFSSNPIDSWLNNLSVIEAEAKKNPRIKELSKQYGFKININGQELKKLKLGHLQDTRIVAAKIYSNLTPEMKKQVNLNSLQTAAMYHDVGKILIPNKILNKPGKLNNKEWEVMQLHSELSYELLKNKGLNDGTLELIKNHHSLTGRNSSKVNGNIENNITLQILSTADKYSALTEERAYKKSLSKAEALDIIHNDVKDGIILKDVFNALSRIPA